MQRRTALLSLAALAAAACTESKPQFKAVDITGADYAHDFPLPDADGKPRGIKDFAGKVVVLFFGFTRCPDICPTTLAEIANAVKSLGTADAERVQVLFITVDPERDTAEALSAYVGAFDPRFVALRGDAAATQRVAKDFKIYYEKRKQGETYTVDHSAQAYVLDAQGRLRLLVRHDRIDKDLAPDLRTLLREAR